MARDSTKTTAPRHEDIDLPAAQTASKEHRRSILDIDFENEEDTSLVGNTDEQTQMLRAVAQAIANENLESLIEEHPTLILEWVKIAFAENQNLTKDLDNMDERLSQQINELKTTIKNQKARTKELEKDLATERQQRSQTPASTEVELSKKRSVKLPDPEIFKDNKDGRIMQWLRMMKDKLKNNADHYPTEDSKMAYIYSY